MSTSTTPTDLPALLRFLTQSASLPLSTAMRKIPDLQRAQLSTPSAIAALPLSQIRDLLFPDDEKAAKSLLNAAKRIAGGGSSAKRKNDTGAEEGSGGRRKRRKSPLGEEATPAEIEASLVLPSAEGVDEAALLSVVLFTNRAPLCLAFAVTLLKFSMPKQPLSSRLSLAQAMVSLGARAKAVNLGLEKKGAEDEGWGEGQPVVRVMGREIRVLRRWGYEVDTSGPKRETAEGGEALQASELEPQGAGSQQEEVTEDQEEESEPALWGLDLEALKKSNGPPLPNAASHGSSGLPIFYPQSARAYLLKSFATAGGVAETPGSKQSKAKKEAEDKERNLGLLLSALEMLYQSWIDTLSPQELDRRAWSWYVTVRPDVENGVAGWGGKGEVKLSQVLDLRRSG